MLEEREKSSTAKDFKNFAMDDDPEDFMGPKGRKLKNKRHGIDKLNKAL